MTVVYAGGQTETLIGTRPVEADHARYVPHNMYCAAMDLTGSGQPNYWRSQCAARILGGNACAKGCTEAFVTIELGGLKVDESWLHAHTCAECGRSVTLHSRGLCRACFDRLRDDGTLEQKFPRLNSRHEVICACGCGKKGRHHASGMLEGCYKRVRHLSLAAAECACGCGKHGPIYARGMLSACYRRALRREGKQKAAGG